MEKKYTISTKIYQEDSIAQAIEDFAEVSPISFSQETLSIQWDSEDEIQEIFREFMNYVLSL